MFTFLVLRIIHRFYILATLDCEAMFLYNDQNELISPSIKLIYKPVPTVADP